MGLVSEERLYLVGKLSVCMTKEISTVNTSLSSVITIDIYSGGYLSGRPAEGADLPGSGPPGR